MRSERKMKRSFRGMGMGGIKKSIITMRPFMREKARGIRVEGWGSPK